MTSTAPVQTATHALWHRPDRRRPWVRLFVGSEYQCNRHFFEVARSMGGDFLVSDRDPNHDTRASTRC